MVGIVLVSHHAKLAEGIRDLAEQMVHGQVPIAVAGGIDDPENPFGTDAMKVCGAIESVYSPDGVVVLMDLGSALLSAETALEFLSAEQRANVELSAAPLVEGALAAVVQASVGGNIRQVLNEARGALAVKQNHMESSEGTQAPPPIATPPVEGALELQLVVRNRMGLHARPAANFVKTASRYQAEIRVSKGDKSANAKSINQVATLGVRHGEQIVLIATGSDAAEALRAFKALADQDFGEADEPAGVATVAPLTAAPLSTNSHAQSVGIPASPGIAIGPVFHYKPTLPEIVAYNVVDVAAEWARLQRAIVSAQTEIQALHAHAARQVGASEAAIFEAHQLFLQDPALLEAAKARIFEVQLNAEAAWQQAFEAIAQDYRALPDEYLRARAADVVDVGQRVLRQLLSIALPSLDLARPAIIIARDLTPSDTTRLDAAKVLGICTELGGATAHSAILARALGIPAVVALNGALRDVPEGQVIALDGTTGQVWLHPNEEQLAELAARRAAWQRELHKAKASAQQPATTPDGRVIEVAANIGGPHDTQFALECGAEGVGLFRTEFLFLDRANAPTEEEQLVAYGQVAQAIGRRPLIIRTLDVGGDKPLPYLDLGHEDNPFLGWRAIRFCLDHPDLFKSQLRAILRASAGHNLKLMFPMIGTLGELRTAKRILADVQAELRGANIAFDENMEIGIMIEVPSAVVIADQLAAEVDFFSIGSNDLTQYVMAADRGNHRVAHLADALHPAVLRMIAQTVQAAHTAGIWVGMCGELAGNALATPVLIGMGMDELSMSAPSIPRVKAAIRQLNLERAQQIARTVVTLESAEAVQVYLESRL
jgi:multiphosphoryl transfer protein